MNRIALTAFLVVLALTCAGAANLPPVFFGNAAMTYGIEIDYASWPAQTMRLWQGDGEGNWWPTYRQYDLYFDHGWFSEWRNVNRPTERFWLYFLDAHQCVLVEPDVWWWSDWLYQV